MEEDYYRHMADIQARHWWYEGRRRILESVIRRLNLPASASILEVGCGTGANLPMLQKFGAVAGVEPHEWARRHAAGMSGCDVRDGMLPGEIPFSGPFDLVGAFDVIEHVDQDLESLRALYRLTKPGGHALFTVPAWRFLWSQHDVVNHHKRRYARGEFESLLRQAGFSIEFISYYNFWLFPAVALVRVIKNAMKIDGRPDMTRPGNSLINALLARIFASERFLLNSCRLPFGVSIVALCRKEASS